MPPDAYHPAGYHCHYHDAERKGMVNRNVARLANAPSLTTARARGPEMTVWTPAELSAFLASIEGNRNEAMFRLLAMTGMRRGEVVGLRWSDVQLDRHRLTVNQAATVVDGDEMVDVPKTRRSRRVIDLDTPVHSVPGVERKPRGGAAPVSYTHLTLPTNREV